MHSFLFRAPALWPYKPIQFQENKLASGWTGIAPSYLNMFMPSLNNYKTRSQMALDIPLCRTNKGQKGMSFLGPKIRNRISSNIKQTCHHTWSVSPEKNKYITASIVSSLTTLELGVFEGHSQPPKRVQDRALLGVQGAKPPKNFAFLILKIL